VSETLLATITRSSSSRTRACVVSCNLLAAGHHTVEELTESRRPSNGQPYKIPRLMAAKEGERTQLMRILLSRGIGGIGDRTRGLTQRWFDMVDWRSAHVGNTRLGVSRSIEGYTETLKGEVHQQHPARTWVERQEQKSGGMSLNEYQPPGSAPPVADGHKPGTGSGGSNGRGWMESGGSQQIPATNVQRPSTGHLRVTSDILS
jgi:hypothetical protein